MSKVLVVGGAGYIGGTLTDQLLDAGHEVLVYDNLLFEERYLKPVGFVLGDIRDEQRLKPHLAWADATIWLAGMVGDGACSLHQDITEEVNVESVRWLVRNFDRRIIFMSSCSIYGAQDDLLTEESPLNPLSLYAKTKVLGEEILADTGAIIFRLGTLFGLGDTYSRIRLDLVLNLLTVKACLYKRISVFGGEQYRPLLHVRDAAGAVVQNIDTEHTGVFNLHTENMKILDIANRIADHVSDIQIDVTELKFQDQRNYKIASDKARSTFGFSPELTADDGIAEIKKVIDEGRIHDINSARYSNTDFLRPLLQPQDSPLGREIIGSKWKVR